MTNAVGSLKERALSGHFMDVLNYIEFTHSTTATGTITILVLRGRLTYALYRSLLGKA